MKAFLNLAAIAALCCICSTSNAQNRTIGANKVVLDDGSGHTVTLQTQTPAVTGILTLPSGSANIANMANGTVTGQTTRWNAATSQWEVSPSLTNVGSAVANAGSIATTGASGTITASTSLSAGSTVTAGSYVAPGAAMGSATPVNGGVYTDNMIQAAGSTDINGAPYIQVGNYSVTHPAVGQYLITFAYNVPTDPIVMIQAGTNAISSFVISRTPLTIQIYEYFPGAVTPVNAGFSFIAIGPHS
jgi:hypothetical protein